MQDFQNKYPYQQNIPFKYMPEVSEEPAAGNGNHVRNMTKNQQTGYQQDVLEQLKGIKQKLRWNGYELFWDGDKVDVKLLAKPRFVDLEGINDKHNVNQILPKYYADVVKRRELIGILANWESGSDFQKSLVEGLYNPLKSLKPLQTLLEYEASWTPPTDEISDKNYRGLPSKTRADGASDKVIPARDQFDPVLQNVKFEDVFTFFQGANLEQFKLFLGRVCVGHSGTIDKITGKRLKHTYRNILVVNGSNPGEGKSTVCKWLVEALERCGYDVCNSVPSLAGRFNLHKALTSDLAYRDDETADNLAKELASPVAKVMATNDWVATEEKGKDAVSTKCKTALMINTNRLGPEILWGMDDGTRSRIAFCETVPLGVLAEEDKPYNKIPRLAKELGVSIEALMVWCLRLATDEFLKFCNENSHKLEGRIKELAETANRSNNDPLDGVLAALALGAMLTGKPGAKLSKRLNLDILHAGVEGMMYLKQAPEYQTMALGLINTLDTAGDRYSVPAWHPVQGLNQVDPSSLPVAYELTQNRGRMGNPNERMSTVFKSLSLFDGSQCYGNTKTICPRWSSLIGNEYTYNRLKKLADAIRPLLDGEARLPVDVDYSVDQFWNM